MKVYTPEISWHERDPIYTCSFHPFQINKFATSGVTGVIRVWNVEKGTNKFSICRNIKLHLQFKKLWNIKEKEEDISEITAAGIGGSSGVQVDFIASLKRHTKSVNVVRWNHDGKILASAGDEAVVFLWNENEIKNQKTLDMDEDENKENWFSFRTFRLYWLFDS